MKYIRLISCILLLLAASCSSKLLVKTEPVPAKLTIVNKNIVIPEEEFTKKDNVLIKLKPGKYLLRAEHPNFLPGEEEVELHKNETKKVIVNLGLPLKKIIIMSSPPGAEIYINNKLVGKTPYEITLPQGKYKVKLFLKGYKIFTKNIEIKDNVILKVSLISKLSALKLDTNPSGALVVVDDKELGKTPVEVFLSTGKHHKIKIILPGYESWEKEVFLRPFDKLHLKINLKPLKAKLIFKGIKGTKVFINGQEKCKVPCQLDMLLGKYEIVGIFYENKNKRRKEIINLNITSPGQRIIRFKLPKREVKYKGKWIDIKIARLLIKKENKKIYQKFRTKHPVEFILFVDPKIKNILIKNAKDIAEILSNTMKVGDRIIVVFDNKKIGYRAWYYYPNNTKKLKNSLVKAFLALSRGDAVNKLSVSEKGKVRVKGTLNEKELFLNLYPYSVKLPYTPDILGGVLAIAINFSRSHFPILFLQKEQLKLLKGLNINISKNDGLVDIILVDNKDFLSKGINNKTFSCFKKVCWASIKNRDIQWNIAWTQPPYYLLAISHRSRNLSPLPEELPVILRNEKRFFKFFSDSNNKIVEYIRFQRRFGNDSWSVITRKIANNPISINDLSEGAMGPHEIPGIYERIWLLKVKDLKDVWQREYRLIYKVVEQAREVQGRHFLRRGKVEKPLEGARLRQEKP